MFLLFVYMVKHGLQHNHDHCIEKTQTIEDIFWIFRTSRILIYVYLVLRSPFAASIRDNGLFLCSQTFMEGSVPWAKLEISE